MRIAVVAARYSVSGVPLTQIRFARALGRRGHQVDLIFGQLDDPSVVPDLPGVRLLVLGRSKARGMLLPLRRYLRRERPDIVFSSQDNLNGFVLLAAILAGSRAKISGSSRVPASFTYGNRPFTAKWLNKHLMRAVMWRADVLTCISEGMVREYQGLYRKARHVAVYNLVDDAAARGRMAEPVTHPWFVDKATPIIVSAGRFTPLKGFADLVRATGLLVRAGRNVRTVILGDGITRPELEALVAELGLEDRVSLPGQVANPLAYFARSEVFAMTSRAEGLGNVLIEAMLCGCSLVATDCPPGGPAEILGHGAYGRLVPVGDVDALAAAIGHQLDHPTAPELLEEALRRFGEDAVLGRHFELLGLDHPGRIAA